MTQYVCIGVPYYIGQRSEERTAVEAIKNSGIAAEIGAQWVEIHPDFHTAPDKLSAVNRALAQTIRAHADCVPIVFACDCTAALGVFKGLEPRRSALIWYDAHGDFNTEQTTPSGFLGGMPLAWLVGDGNQQYMEGVGLAPIPPTDVILTDGRDLDPAEAVRVENSKLTHLKTVDELLTAALPDKPVYIHFDTDVVDIEDFPGMNYPAPDGPSLDTIIKTLERVARDTQMVAFSFSLWNDTLPTGGKALAATLKIVRAFVAAHS